MNYLIDLKTVLNGTPLPGFNVPESRDEYFDILIGPGWDDTLLTSQQVRERVLAQYVEFLLNHLASNPSVLDRLKAFEKKEVKATERIVSPLGEIKSTFIFDNLDSTIKNFLPFLMESVIAPSESLFVPSLWADTVSALASFSSLPRHDGIRDDSSRFGLISLDYRPRYGTEHFEPLLGAFRLPGSSLFRFVSDFPGLFPEAVLAVRFFPSLPFWVQLLISRLVMSKQLVRRGGRVGRVKIPDSSAGLLSQPLNQNFLAFGSMMNGCEIRRNIMSQSGERLASWFSDLTGAARFILSRVTTGQSLSDSSDEDILLNFLHLCAGRSSGAISNSAVNSAFSFASVNLGPLAHDPFSTLEYTVRGSVDETWLDSLPIYAKIRKPVDRPDSERATVLSSQRLPVVTATQTPRKGVPTAGLNFNYIL